MVTRLGLLLSEVAEKRNDEARKFHATRPVYANIGYGMPVSTRATRVKMTEKMMVLMMGISTAHPKPIAVCL